MEILSLIASNNFITLNKILINEIGLEESIMFGELASEYDYWDKEDRLEDGWFYSTIENVEKNTTLNGYKQRKALNKLNEIGLIDIKLCGMPAKRYIKINQNAVVQILNNKMFKNSTTRCLKFKQQDVQNLNINNNNINKNKNNNNKSIYSSPAKAEQQNVCKGIIDYLNLKTNKHFKYTSNNIGYIKTRLKEGFTKEDFKSVIDKKTNEWLNDNKMNQYLRPITLFGSKFESYLNQEEKEKTLNDISIDELKEANNEYNRVHRTNEVTFKDLF